MNQQRRKSVVSGYLFLLLISAVYSFTNTSLEIKGILSTSIIIIESLFFLLFLYFVGRYNIKKLLKIAFLLSIGGIHYLMARETVFLIMLMVAVIFTELEYRKAFKLLFFERLFFLILIVFFSLTGILSVQKTEVFKGGLGINTFGYGLGFNHPNQLAYNVGLLLLFYICYKRETLRQRHIIGMAFSPWIMPICALAALGLPILMSTATGRFKEILYALNGLIGSRFTHSARVFDSYPVPLWGGIVDFRLLQSNFGYAIVDNGYLCLLYDFGIVGFSLFIILYFLSMRKLANKKEYVFLIAIIAVALWGITENILRSFAINFTVVFWAECIKKGDRINSK